MDISLSHPLSLSTCPQGQEPFSGWAPIHYHLSLRSVERKLRLLDPRRGQFEAVDSHGKYALDF